MGADRPCDIYDIAELPNLSLAAAATVEGPDLGEDINQDSRLSPQHRMWGQRNQL